MALFKGITIKSTTKRLLAEATVAIGEIDAADPTLKSNSSELFQLLAKVLGVAVSDDFPEMDTEGQLGVIIWTQVIRELNYDSSIGTRDDMLIVKKLVYEYLQNMARL